MTNNLKIWIFQTGEPLFCDGSDIRPMRAINLASQLISSGHDVEIISSQFYHQKKIHRRRKLSNKKSKSIKHKETLIWSPGYKSNIGIMRFLDHFILSANLFIYLVFRLFKERPDIFYIGYPPVDWSFSSIFVSKIFSIKSILEVSDLWPDLFFEKNNKKSLDKIIRFIFLPYILMARYCAKSANAICAPTYEMANFFYSKYSAPSKNDKLIFETPLVPPPSVSKKDYVISYPENNLSKKLNIIFFGSLMSIYDFKIVSLALEKLSDLDISLKIIGDGGSIKEIKNTFEGISNVDFTGWLDYEKILRIVPDFDIALAPYKNITNYKLNIPNKIVDYLSLGLPILSPLDGCVERLIVENNIGFNYQNHNQESLIKILRNLTYDKKILFQKSKNSRNLYNKKFKFDVVYQNLEEKIKNQFLKNDNH